MIRRVRRPLQLSAHVRLGTFHTYHLSRLGVANREFEIGIFLPVSEKERELGKEAVVDVANEFDGRWARVARDAAFEVLRASD